MANTAIHLRHPAPLEFVIDRLGGKFLLPLPTRDQMRRAMELDPEDEAAAKLESMADLDARRGLQLAIFAEGTPLPIDQLTAHEEVQIIHAIVAAHHGQDPVTAVALQQTLKKKGSLLAALLALSAWTETDSGSQPS